ncbi:uncharacterized protein LOC109616565 isoform X2 [Esox lucius]|uniref:uncharacterized protein LOC109616565 isoform X2 n=1 Tax=Esox lucius TaxID=8010 RepID=UPI0010BD01DB|nr:uncharacterized protein LOC109616565 isoform X2 [Esox lucius]
MIIFILILSAVSRKAILQTTALDIFPAKIFRTAGTIMEGSDLELKCSTHGRKDEQKIVHVYLCKNGVAVEKIMNRKDDTIFTLRNIDRQQSGNYSCVFSNILYTLSEVREKGDNSIYIQVIDRILPAVISITGSNSAKQGDVVEFKCTISDPIHTSELVHSYLCMNGTHVQVQVFDVYRMEATFTIKDVKLNDRGNYSCVLDLQPKRNEFTERQLYGSNTAFLQVDVWSYQIPVVMFCVCLLLVFLLIVGIYWLIRKQGVGNLCCRRTPPNDVQLSDERESNISNMEEESCDEFDSLSEEDISYQNVPDLTQTNDMIEDPGQEADDTYQDILDFTRIKHTVEVPCQGFNQGAGFPPPH